MYISWQRGESPYTQLAHMLEENYELDFTYKAYLDGGTTVQGKVAMHSCVSGPTFRMVDGAVEITRTTSGTVLNRHDLIGMDVVKDETWERYNRFLTADVVCSPGDHKFYLRVVDEWWDSDQDIYSTMELLSLHKDLVEMVPDNKEH